MMTTPRLYDALNLLITMQNTYNDLTPQYAALGIANDLIDAEIIRQKTMAANSPAIVLPVSLDEARAHEHFVISDGKGSVLALIPGEPNHDSPSEPPDDPEAKAWAEAIVTAVNGPSLIPLAEAVIAASDNTGCSDDLTVTSYAAVELLREAIDVLKGGR